MPTDASGLATEIRNLLPGPYRAVLETDDGFGKTVTAILPLQVLDPNADQLAIKIPNLVAAPNWSVEPGTTSPALWGTGYEAGRAFVEVEHRGKCSRVTGRGRDITQSQMEQRSAKRCAAVSRCASLRCGKTAPTAHTRKVDVPWTNKQLAIRWEHFVSKLKPGQEETWTAIITGPEAESAVAEMVATLYDASLDAYLPHSWRNWRCSGRTIASLNMQFQNASLQLRNLLGHFDADQQAGEHHLSIVATRDRCTRDVRSPMCRAWTSGGAAGRLRRSAAPSRGRRVDAEAALPMEADALRCGRQRRRTAGQDGMESGMAEAAAAARGKPPVDLSKVSARKNLNETAFFFPHLISGQRRPVSRMTFTMPEALTEWKFLGFAHDSQMRSGSFTDTAVTSKDLMVEPLAPRFVREGDVLEFTVKVTNQSPTRQTGTVRLSLSDARTLGGG